jgi:hypothetical protein
MKPAEGFAKGGVLKLRVQLRCDNPGGVPAARGLLSTPGAPPTPPEALLLSPSRSESVSSLEPSDSGECLPWGDYSSSYATNFTGYSECSERLSDLHSDEAAFHHHEFLVPAPDRALAPPRLFTLAGAVVGGRGLPTPGGRPADTYVVVNVANKSNREFRKQQSQIVPATADPDYNFPFDLGDVRKGLRVEFTVFEGAQGDADAALAFGKIEVKEIPLDSQEPIQITLQAPPADRFKSLKWTFTEWGRLTVMLNQAVKQATGATE